MSGPTTNKAWRPFDDECAHCGGDAEVLTGETEPGYARDGDRARCSSCGCPGCVFVDEEPHAYIQWHDDPLCDCSWCVAMRYHDQLMAKQKAEIDRLRAIVERLNSPIDIRFDGPPGPEAGRFVEVECGGRSISLGSWAQSGDYWLLSFTASEAAEAAKESDA